MDCPWPDCDAELEGLRRFCHACERRAEDADNPKAENLKRTPTATGRQVLVLPLPPSVNRMYRSVAGARKGLVEAVNAYQSGPGTWRQVLAQLYVNVTVSKEGKLWKKSALEWLNAQPLETYDGDVRMLVTWYLERWGSDTDNRLKPLQDVLEGWAFEDDKAIGELHVVRRKDKDNPRCVVVLEPDDRSTVLDPGATFNYDLGF